jgi:dihydrofolate reductase
MSCGLIEAKKTPGNRPHNPRVSCSDELRPEVLPLFHGKLPVRLITALCERALHDRSFVSPFFLEPPERCAVRKLILFVATSLDGYIAGPNEEIDWLFTDQDYGYREFYARIDTVLMGRKTYDLALSFGDYPYPGAAAYVFSRAPRQPDGHAQFVAGEVGAFVEQLKRQPGRDIWLVGGGQIVRECLVADAVDEFVISVHPILLGAGIPLFPAGFPKRSLALQHVQRFESGLVQTVYARVR